MQNPDKLMLNTVAEFMQRRELERMENRQQQQQQCDSNKPQLYSFIFLQARYVYIAHQWYQSNRKVGARLYI